MNSQCIVFPVVNDPITQQFSLEGNIELPGAAGIANQPFQPAFTEGDFRSNIIITRIDESGKIVRFRLIQKGRQLIQGNRFAGLELFIAVFINPLLDIFLFFRRFINTTVSFDGAYQCVSIFLYAGRFDATQEIPETVTEAASAAGSEPGNITPGLRVILPLGNVDTGSQVQTTRCLLYTSPSPRDVHKSRMPSSA